MSWTLPESLVVGGREYSINADYRDILLVLEHMNMADANQGVYNALYVFYNGFDAMPSAHHQEAWDALCNFIRCGEPEGEAEKAKLIDWEQDANMIAAEVSKVAGAEVRAVEFMHWFTFMGFFSAIGEGQLATLVSIRSKKAKGKKLEKWEQEYYRENKSRVDFAQRYTQTEEEDKAAILRLLGE